MRDDYYSVTSYQSEPPLVGYTKYTTEVFLSNPYTLGQLDADTDALLNAIDPASIPFGEGQVTIYENDSLGGLDLAAIYQGFTQELLPAIAQYYPPRGPFVAMRTPPAWPGSYRSIQHPHTRRGRWLCFRAEPVRENRSSRPMTNRARTIIQRLHSDGRELYQNGIGRGLEAGIRFHRIVNPARGGCGMRFRVNPPPIIVGQDAYTMIVANCQCTPISALVTAPMRC